MKRRAFLQLAGLSLVAPTVVGLLPDKGSSLEGVAKDEVITAQNPKSLWPGIEVIWGDQFEEIERELAGTLLFKP